MKNSLIFILFFLLSLCGKCFSQDYVVKMNNDTIKCSIIKIDNEKIYYKSTDGEKYYSYLLDVKFYYRDGVKNEISKEVSKKDDTITCKDIQYNLFKAGYELKSASNNYYWGLGLTLAGSFISIAGMLSWDDTYGYSNPSQKSNIVVLAGGAISLVGLIMTIESMSHIGHAGDLLMKATDRGKKFSLNGGSNGIELVYRF